MATPSTSRAATSIQIAVMAPAIRAPAVNSAAANIRTRRRPKRSMIGPAKIAAIRAPSGTAAVMKPRTPGDIG
jgi:hypothetical protein